MKLDRAPLLDNASIRDFQRGTAGYIADAVEQSLLLPKDMVDFRSMRQHEVFLELKKDLAMAIQATFRAKEMMTYSHRKMKEEEEERRIAAVDAFHVAEKSNQKLKSKLQEEEKERKSVSATLNTVVKQAEGQRILLCNVEDQLAASNKQIVALKKKFEEVEKAKVLVEKAKEEAEKAKEEA